MDSTVLYHKQSIFLNVCVFKMLEPTCAEHIYNL